MNFLRGFSKFLMIFPTVTFLYDVIDGWFVNNGIKFRSLNEWITLVSDAGTASVARSALQSVLPKLASDLMGASASIVLLIPPVVLYLLYRFIFALKGGRGGGGYTYKSRD